MRQHLVAGDAQVLAIHERRACHGSLGQQRLQQCFARMQRKPAQVAPVEVQQVKGAIGKRVGVAVLECGLQFCEARWPALVGERKFAVHNRLLRRKAFESVRDTADGMGAVEPGECPQHD